MLYYDYYENITAKLSFFTFMKAIDFMLYLCLLHCMHTRAHTTLPATHTHTYSHVALLKVCEEFPTVKSHTTINIFKLWEDESIGVTPENMEATVLHSKHDMWYDHIEHQLGYC